ncbi:type II toxin-antitoxin system RelE/ParE family toxin [Xanthobacteraceae bacterium Astr-EGSB]|uniref:type II toxin-antitoxin system RelE/ParE family toxin n=1 Tax=Astrobacterium formosum TaxID=3069710 RepID=UPI0027B0F0E8|nr:type II toxin-antitoxin system RelE/ParE family toxin [Xanthobacteraceae bacterium Astr-EGSB]
MTRVVLTRRAEDELRSIWRAIAEENEPAADRILSAISDKLDLLALHPRLGSRRPDIRPTARMLVEGHYLVLYETHPDRDDGPIDWVEVVSIVDGRRDLSEIFLAFLSERRIMP